MAEGQGLNDKDKGRDDPKGITLSEVVGWATTGIAMVSRTPQVMKVLRSRSVEGLDPTLFEMDTICNTVTAFYHILHNYPINTYGETIAFCIQNVATIYLMSKFSLTAAARRRAKMFMVAYAVGCTYVSVRLKQCRKSIELAQKVSYGGLQLSRFPQIMLNYRNQSAGQLSAVSYVLNIIGSTARLFTTMKQLGGNRALMMGFGSSICINGVLAVQILYYGDASKVAGAKAANAHH